MHVCRALNKNLHKRRAEGAAANGQSMLSDAGSNLLPATPRVSPPSYSTAVLASLRAQQGLVRPSPGVVGHSDQNDAPLECPSWTSIPPSRWALKATQFIFSRRSTDRRTMLGDDGAGDSEPGIKTRKPAAAE